jgi:hypothetical protein
MTTDGQYGVTNDNVTWTGMVGMLMNDEVDIGEQFSFETRHRLTFTVPAKCKEKCGRLFQTSCQ